MRRPVLQAGHTLCPSMKVVTPLGQRKIPAQLVILAENFRWIFFLSLCEEQGWGHRGQNWGML